MEPIRKSPVQGRKYDRSTRSPWLIVMAAFLNAVPSAACETHVGKLGSSPPKTRKPVLGDEVRLTNGFGMRHEPLSTTLKMHPGIDWAAKPGTPVIAAGAGQVVSAGVMNGYGNAVLIDHGGGWQTLYGHLESFTVHQGDCISTNSVLGKMGSTGRTEGPALHFEVRVNGQPTHPMLVPIVQEKTTSIASRRRSTKTLWTFCSMMRLLSWRASSGARAVHSNRYSISAAVPGWPPLIWRRSAAA
jgi:murein DD-endopeptidase MepM/ murein hydrolase activator NlpD